jgi:hypothetical protein
LINLPCPDAAPALARLLGVWGGRVPNEVDPAYVVLVVEMVRASDATIIESPRSKQGE